MQPSDTGPGPAAWATNLTPLATWRPHSSPCYLQPLELPSPSGPCDLGTHGGAGTVGSCLSYRHLKQRAQTWARSGGAQWVQVEKGLTQLLGLSD